MNSISESMVKDEPRSLGVKITGNMGPQDVMDRVLKMEKEMEK